MALMFLMIGLMSGVLRFARLHLLLSWILPKAHDLGEQAHDLVAEQLIAAHVEKERECLHTKRDIVGDAIGQRVARRHQRVRF